MHALDFSSLLSMALWLAGAGHFCILFASFQVPLRLNWEKDLAQLHPFNRKLMWVYGGFTVLTIISFGILTIFLHQELLNGDRAALAFAAFVAVYWLARIAVDFFYFESKDWPQGPAFTIGHIFLTGLFGALSSTYILVLLHAALR